MVRPSAVASAAARSASPLSTTIRLIIRKFKPVDWLCRGIVLIFDAFPLGSRWDDEGLTWDQPGLVWGASDTGLLVEHFPPLRP